ncbi:MAG: hypothetical protein U0790_12200 [Isosphaeraceae bacterium]
MPLYHRVQQDGRPPGRRGWPAVSVGELAPLARSPRLRALGHDPELGRGRGKKAARRIEAEYLARGLEDFSGYIAVDELYDGPFCVLSLVDNRTFTRLMYRVLEKAPTRDDIRGLLRDFKARCDARGLTIRGVTTDGSNLYPTPLAEILPTRPIRFAGSTS